jgi:hypothetical protein
LDESEIEQMEKDERVDHSVSPLTPRQAVICAAITGWRGDMPSPWSWPVAAEDIIAWAQSHEQSQNKASLSRGLKQLVSEGLFLPICYPVFIKPYYSCGYVSSFLKELPAEMQFPGWDGDKSIADIEEFWEGLQEKLIMQYGPTPVWWGVCAGQGSEGPSDIPSGPCLGPSCCCYSNKNRDSCHHGLEFVHIAAEKMPDMGFLHYRDWSLLNEDERLKAMDDAILRLKTIAPDLPCFTSKEIDEMCKRNILVR